MVGQILLLGMALAGILFLVGLKKFALRLALLSVLVALVLSLLGAAAFAAPLSGVADTTQGLLDKVHVFLLIAAFCLGSVIVGTAVVRFIRHYRQFRTWRQAGQRGTSLKRRVSEE